MLAGHDEYLPEIGKYNAGQKFVFWSQAVLVCVLFVTGDRPLGWQAAVFRAIDRLPPTHGRQKRWAAVIHATAAVLTIIVWIIHVYAAIWVRGTIPAMTRGTVSGGWGWRHHRSWLRRRGEKARGDPGRRVS